MTYIEQLIEQANKYTKAQENDCKAFILSNGLNKLFSRARFVYNYVIDNNDIPPGVDIEEARTQAKIYSLFDTHPNIKRLCENLNKSTQSRTKRLKNKVEKMVTFGTCTFVTLTFNNDTLETTNEKTRRVYVARYLKSQSLHYIANVDYGKENEREHYHAIVFGTCKLNDWRKYGNINVKKVRITPTNEEKTVTKVSKYISKLTNHAIKNTTKGKRMIYSKNFKQLVLQTRNMKLAKNDQTFALGLELFGDMLKSY